MENGAEQEKQPEALTTIVTYKCFDCGGRRYGHEFEEPHPFNYPSSVPCIIDEENTATAVKSRRMRVFLG